MKAPRLVIGIDFGTLSARAVLVDAANGKEVASASAEYAHGVIEVQLPASRQMLKPKSALQNPADYLDCLQKVVRAVMRKAGASASQVAGIGTDFTSCTVLPTFADGQPLCLDKAFARNPHAWVKLWKHHATQPEADHINETGRRRGEQFISAYGGQYSSEWFFSKVLETIRDAPEVYRAADRFIEGGDWIVWQLCGRETRNVSAAGFKGMRVHQEGGSWTYPEPDFFAELHPGLRNVIAEKVTAPIVGLGSPAGALTAEMASRLGLKAGIPVAAGNIDAHAGVPACGVTRPGEMVMIMGTSTCHLLVSDRQQEVEGMCGVVRDGVIPGYWGYEAGQAGVGDLFGWYVEHGAPSSVQAEARRRRTSVHDLLSAEAARLEPGQTGLVALDWWNGNRSVLMDADLSGVLFGLTLQTRPAEIYRALIEATAFGTRKIIEAFASKGVPIENLVACGGLAQRNPVLMQIYADVLQQPIKVAAAAEASALGAAIFAATAAGLYPSVEHAVRKMVRKHARIYKPRSRHAEVYRELYSIYTELHDQFGRHSRPLMKRLSQMRRERASA